MRPAQWLGFLKIMTALGAEYVETGYFAPLVFNAKWKNVQLPQNYVPPLGNQSLHHTQDPFDASNLNFDLRFRCAHVRMGKLD